jgi:hypothetical protein
MKRVLVLLVVVQAVMFLSGCEKKSDKPGDGSGEEVTKPAQTDAEVTAPVWTGPVEPEEPAPKPDVSRGLAGWWNFDETSGATAEDSSGQGRNGTLKGGASFDKDSMEGRTGKALNFAGEGAEVQIEGYKGISGTAPRTVAAWIKTEHNDGRILSYGREEGGAMFMFCFIRGRVGVTPKGGYLYMNDKISDNNWHHVAAVVEEAELPNLHDDVKVYKDGEIAEIHDIGILDLWPIDTASDSDVIIGQGFRGALDDVRLYDRALSQKEIELLFKQAGK